MVTFMMPRLAYDMQLMNYIELNTWASCPELECQTKTIRRQFVRRLRGFVFLSGRFSEFAVQF